ncbi:MAG: helix-turn-helix domain-containing protein [Candidatus Competibacteraceae bacterium]|jgi:AraC-like DNA-binding protein|nr:helix-turn-helix domain-containing protein [Candidatus Competibacteraceae bacterium]
MSASDERPQTRTILASTGHVASLFAAKLGLPLERFIASTRIDLSALLSPSGRINEEFLPRFLRLMEKIYPAQNVSLDMALRIPITFLGTPIWIITQAPDLETYLNLCTQNCDLVADRLDLSLLPNGAEVGFRIHHPLDESDAGLGGEFSIALNARIIREQFGYEVMTRVQFRHAARNPVALYESYFGVPVVFGAPYNALVFHANALQESNRKAALTTREALERQLLHLRRELGLDQPDWLAMVRAAVVRNAQQDDYSVTGLAHQLAMSPRNLQRRLRAAGTSAMALIDSARYDRTLELLAYEGMSMEEVAKRVGFYDERSFRRAFQRWAQKTPAQVRREIRTPHRKPKGTATDLPALGKMRVKTDG